MKYLNLFEHFEPKKIAGREETAKVLKIFPKPTNVMFNFKIKEKDYFNETKWNLSSGELSFYDSDNNGEENTFQITEGKINNPKNPGRMITTFHVNVLSEFDYPWDKKMSYIPNVEILESEEFFIRFDKNDAQKIAKFLAITIMDNIMGGMLSMVDHYDDSESKVQSDKRKYTDYMYDSLEPFTNKILKKLKVY